MTMHDKPLKGLRQIAVTAAVSAGILLSFTAAADAAQQQPKRDKLWKDIGASERVDFSGRLNMLSQRIAASTCSMEAGVAPDISRGIIAGSVAEIDRIMNALRNGNARMKIVGQETDPRVLASITKVDGSWGPIRTSLNELHETGYTNRNLSFIEVWEAQSFDDANLLVSEISAHYSNPADLLQSDAILVDLAGRQRVRTQQMLKEACKIWKGEAGADDLLTTIGFFDRTLAALKNGEPSVGIKGAPSDAISASLDSLQSDWANVQPVLSGIAAGINVEGQTRVELYLSLNEMLIKSNKIVTQYTKFVKRTY